MQGVATRSAQGLWRRYARPALFAGVAVLAFLALGTAPSHADTLRFCDQIAERSATEQDKLFRLATVIRTELEGSGHRASVMSRSGLNLRSLGVRYSHAALSLKANRLGPWSVRQLYYACDEQRPRIFDQGIAAFVLGFDNASVGYVSVVLLPDAAGAELELAALDNRRALQLLHPTYSANGYAFSERYQNCNQWVIEMMAATLGRLFDPYDLNAAEPANDRPSLRARAQSWLRDQGYSPTVFTVAFRPLLWLATFIPFVNLDDHPRDDLDQNQLRVSMPAAIEDFVRMTVPGATRIEFCHTDRHVVIRRGWEPIAEGCEPGPHDTVVGLD